MRTFICLVRHGQTDWNKDTKIQGRIDIPLNDTGRLQAKETGEKILNSNIKYDVFLSSPLSRAKETGEIIKNILGNTSSIITRENLTEREFGQGDGLSINDDTYEVILRDGYEGMEKAEDIKKRAMNEIMEIVKLYEGKNILIATHSHFIKALFINIDPSITFRGLLTNGSVNYVTIEDGVIIDSKFNQ